MKKWCYSLVIIFTITVLLSLSASSAELTDITQLQLPALDSSHAILEFAFSFDTNFIFEKYDVSMYLDEEHVADLQHGQGYNGKMVVTKGEHVLSFYKTDDANWKGIFEFDVNEYTFLTGKIHTRYSSVDVSYLRTKARYDLVSGEDREYLKQYDNIINNLYNNFDTVYTFGGKSGRRTGSFRHYYFFNANEKTYMSFGYRTSPAGTYSHTTYSPEFGTYSGELESGNIVMVSSSFEEKKVNEFRYDGHDFKEADFHSACETFVTEVFPDIDSKIRFNVRYNLKKSYPTYFKLIFPNAIDI